ncbi:hypothetical protein [Allorhizocola rhizosphaerae]|uniref:hypothetical protein n=1 Tax=Allorhizocola rhizosphaerae TaxID=1872709 RepID=UPI0013C36A41|nr:hypothetical protein [Allorhizocola rhizosphaerae]
MLTEGASIRFLSRVIHEHVERCPGIRIQAEMQGSGRVYVLDGRTADPGGRVPPEAIVGAVRVEAGVTVRALANTIPGTAC